VTRAAVAACLAALAVAAPASAAAPLLGIKGDAARFQSLSGQNSQIRHVIVGWGQGDAWGSAFPALFGQLGPVPMIGIGTSRNGAEAITPKDIALGKGDGYFMALGNAIHEFGNRIYIRPMGEMNGYWNPYCAYTKSGQVKPNHETSWFRKAFARIYLIVHGGPATVLDAKLKALGLPGVGQDLPENPLPNTRVVWNPQGFGSPDVPGNSAQAYYPGDAYVDVVGNDLYDIRGKAEWAAADKLYKAHKSKPYSFPEWGLWGIDDPAFVKTMADFVKSHARVEFLAYFESAPGSIFDLGSKPKSAAAYRRLISPLAVG
jgi:hypothetical protein